MSSTLELRSTVLPPLQVLLCPPAGCFSRGCVGHRFTDKQPAACGLDTNAPIGTTFVLQFVVYDSRGLNDTVQRVVTIASPCEDPSNFICDGVCSEVRGDNILPG